MTTNYVLLTGLMLLVQMPLCIASIETIDEAIEASDMNAFKKFLRRAGVVEKRDKKHLLEIAEDVVDMRKENVSLFKSRWDALKAIGGTTLGLVGAFATYKGGMAIYKRKVIRTVSIPFTTVTAGATCYGFYEALRGFTCQTAKKRLVAAQKMVKEIERLEVEQPKLEVKG